MVKKTQCVEKVVYKECDEQSSYCSDKIISSTLIGESILVLGVLLSISYVAGQYINKTFDDNSTFIHYMGIVFSNIGISLIASVIARVIYRDPLRLFDYNKCCPSICSENEYNSLL
jgi:hypothetical protein